MDNPSIQGIQEDIDNTIRESTRPIIQTVKNPGVTRVQYSPPFSAICSIGRAPFHGTIEITYRPGERLLEFESFERWLRANSNTRLTIEELAVLTQAILVSVLGNIPMRVEVKAETTVHAPVSVVVETHSTL